MLLATVVWICTPRIYGEYSYPSATESRFCCALFFQSCLRKSSIPSGPHSKTKIILGLTRTYAKSIIVTRQTRRGKKRKNLRRRFIIGVLQPPAQATGIEGGDRTVFPCSTPETSFYGLISCPLTLPISHHVVTHVRPISSWLFCALFYSFKLCPYILLCHSDLLRGSMSIVPSFWSHLHHTTRSIASAHSLWSPPQRNSQPPAF